MSLARVPKHRQRGAALMIIAALLIMGVAWFAVAAVSRSPVASLEREAITARSLHLAKQALLAYVAQYAARGETPTYTGSPEESSFPGRMPCPESLNAIGGGSEGEASSACVNTSVLVGRLPWKTLGLEPLTDGDGERLWYALSPNFHPIAFPPTSPALNFDTAAALPFTDTGAGASSNVVALIIAPGRPLTTTGDPATPPAGCSKVSQVSRYVAPLDPAKFLECENAGGAAFKNHGTSQWTNDRIIAITQAEWVAAIAPAIGDRLQREVAPAIWTWEAVEQSRTGRSWRTTYSAANLGYLPFASDWGDPTTTDYCGNQQTPSSGTVRPRGLMPIDPSCYNNAWTVNGVSTGGLLNIFGGGTGCTDMGSYLRCRFQRILGFGAATAQITLTATNVARAFRSTLVPADLTITNSGSATMSMSMPNTTSDATMTINLTWPANILIIAIGQIVDVNIPHLQNAQIHSDSRITWFWNHGWHRYTWYAVSDDATISNTDASYHCDTPGGPGCLTVQDLPASSGNTNDKWLVLVLSGPPLSGQTRPSSSLADYFERQNGSLGVVYQLRKDGDFPFNDWVATCPFKYQNHAGTDVSICN